MKINVGQVKNPPPLLSVVLSKPESRPSFWEIFWNSPLWNRVSSSKYVKRTFLNSVSGLAGNWAGSCTGCTMRSSAFPQHIQYICILPNSNCNSNHCFKETMKISTNSRDHMKKKLISLLKTRDSELTSTFIYIVIGPKNLHFDLQKSLWFF